MREIILLLLAFLFGLSLKSQNKAPDILKYGTEVSPGSNYVRIVYDLTDNENDDIKITLKISNNGGKDYLFPVGTTSGDIGFPVKPGQAKNIQWYFPDTVTFNSLTTGRFIVKLIAEDLKEFDIQTIVDQVDSMALYMNLNLIQGIRHRTEGVQHLQEVKNLIKSRFNAYGLFPEKDEFIYADNGNNYLAQNIIGKLCGNEDETVFFIIDGHYDSVGWAPGADDNGSAVAGVLEAARILSVIPFKKTIRFICFDLEEARISGSRHYVAEGISQNEQLEGVINFEMLGYYNNNPNTQEIPAGFETLFPDFYQKMVQNNFRGNFAFNVANVASNDLKMIFDNASAKYVPKLKTYSLATSGVGALTPDLRRSDHSSFWDGGYKALMINDGANFRNKNYHTANDVLDSLNFTFMSNVVKASIATIAELAVPIHGIARPFAINEYSVYANVADIKNEKQLIRIVPNPITDKANVYFKVTHNGKVRLDIYNSNGILVKNLINENHMIGEYEYSFDDYDLNPGLYIYNYSIDDNFVESGKIIIF